MSTKTLNRVTVVAPDTWTICVGCREKTPTVSLHVNQGASTWVMGFCSGCAAELVEKLSRKIRDGAKT